MPLDWLNAPIEDNVAALLARKRRAKTIELLRAQLQGRVAPNAQVRMQLCDLLIQAGRGPEAVPVLLGLADEFATDGFVAKAVALLKRVERIDPGPHVDSRLQALVRQQRASGPGGAPGPGEKQTSARHPELGMEEIGPEASEAPMSAELASTPPQAGVPAEPPEEAVEATPAEEALPPEELPKASEQSPPAGLPVLEVPGRPAESSGVAERIRGVFRRFLATLPGTELVPLESAPTVEPTPAPEAPAVEPPLAMTIPTKGEAPETEEVLEVDSVAESTESTVLTAEPMADVEHALPAEFIVETPPPPGPAAASPTETLPPTPPTETIPPARSTETLPPVASPVHAEGESMSDVVFEEHLLDLVEEVLHRSPAVPRTPQPAATLDRGRVVEYASRLLGMPLFGALAEDELLAVMRGLQLHLAQPGDIVITEGESSQSLFVVVSGAVKVFVRNQAGRNFEVAVLRAGEFFGEISSLSGRPRTATVIASRMCELLELDRATLDTIAATHRRVCDVLEDAYITRASSPEAAAVRAVPPADMEAQQRAIEVLSSHFGENRWDPRMRLRLADLLLKSGKDQDAVPILIGLADDLAREGFPERAIAVLKKIERVQRRDIEYVSLAPLVREDPPEPALKPEAAPPARTKPQRTEEFFQGWLVDVVRDTVAQRRASTGTRATTSHASLRSYGPGLLISPLFEDFTEDELLAFIQGLRLLTFEPGDVVVTEGEPGDSVFIVATGTVTVFVRSVEGRNVRLCSLGEGSFFGEMSTLSGEPRNATVTAAAHCELLELDRAALGEIAADHARVLKILEEFSRARAADPQAAALRRASTPK